MARDNSLALLDADFLKKLDQFKNKKIIAKVISLSWEEKAVAEITGNIVSGSINVDGSSIVRRTCNLTMIIDGKEKMSGVQAEQVNWSLYTKFRLYIGVYNEVDSTYEKIIWFPQGTFIITSFSSSLNTSGYQITLQGKDKMCLLNGDVGGQLFAAHDFGTIYTTMKDGTIVKTKIPIQTIIREAVHTYAQEPYGNIIINDLESCGVELVNYIGDDNMYIYEQYHESQKIGEDKRTSINIYSVDGSGATRTGGENLPLFISQASSQICFETSSPNLAKVFTQAVADQGKSYNLIPLKFNGVYYVLLKKIDPENDVNVVAGYKATDLIYPDDLTVAIGGKATEALDKIVKMLGDFEYFYDVDGRFIFQRKRIYFNASWNNVIQPTEDDERYYEQISTASADIYDFLQGYLVESFQNKPQLNALKNDFSIWGAIKGADKKKLPVHLRYAIDEKPITYYSLLEQKAFVADDLDLRFPDGWPIPVRWPWLDDVELRDQPEATGLKCDWRELIYQMAKDNLASQDRINGLSAALSSMHEDNADTKYHYDYDLLNENDFAEYYKWDDIHNTWTQLESKEDFKNCKAHNIFLYGPNEDLAHTELTDAQRTEMNDLLGYDYEVMKSFSSEDEAHGRNIALENELLNKYKAENIVLRTQKELDMWSKTFQTGYDAYYADMLAFWPLIYRTQNKIYMLYNDDWTIELDEHGEPKYSDETLEDKEWQTWYNNNYWNPQWVKCNPQTNEINFVEPESMIFWIDFFDAIGAHPELFKYSVQVIGRRSKTVNDDKVTGIYFRDTPLLLFVSADYEPVKGEDKLAYARINLVPPVSDYFSISAQGTSAKDALDLMVYESTYTQDSVTISTIPVYYLAPNSRIMVQDDASGIAGEYLIKSFSLQLQHDGMMSITATRAADRLV